MPLSLHDATEELTAPGELFEVATEVVDGRPLRVWRNAPSSLRSILELSRGYGEAPFLVFEDERLTFEEHFAAAAAFSHALVARYGVRPGDRVAIAMRNLPEWVVAFYAAVSAGAVAVPLNAWWSGPELAYGIEDSGACVAVVDGERLERLSPHLGHLGTGGLAHVIAARSGDSPVGAEPFAAALESSRKEAGGCLPEVVVAPDDNATIFYTSGTTGAPKGALGTHRNICTNLMSLGFVNARNQLTSRATAERARPAEPSAHLVSVPFFHATGCHAILVASTAVGAKLVMMRRFEPERALELIERERITHFGGVPAVAFQVIGSPDFDKRDTSSVRAVAYGGAQAPPELLRRLRERFPAGVVSNGYGLTETSAVATMISEDDYARKPESVGPPVPVCELRIVSDEGQEVPAGSAGEIWVKGPHVVRGYWNKPEETGLSFVQGWFRTGDVGRLDEEGFLYVVDRMKDVVIRGGENVYSAEVEAAIYELPEVLEVAVVGVPDEVLGEQVAAVVVVRPGSTVRLDDLRADLSGRLAAFKLPSRLFVQDEPLPRNAAGKVLKSELRKQVGIG